MGKNLTQGLLDLHHLLQQHLKFLNLNPKKLSQILNVLQKHKQMCLKNFPEAKAKEAQKFQNKSQSASQGQGPQVAQGLLVIERRNLL